MASRCLWRQSSLAKPQSAAGGTAGDGLGQASLGDKRSRIKLDPAFTELSLLDAIKGNGQPGVMHVASHFKFITGSDESYLLLGDGQTLSLGAIK